MNVNELLLDGFDRLPELVAGVLAGLTAEELNWAPAPGANTVGWLVWHLTRIQDHHVSELIGAEQIWVTGDWADQLGLPADPDDTGYGHTAAQLTAVHPGDPGVLVGYYRAVSARTRGLLATVSAEDLDRVVDRRWDPPVTLGVRLNSVLGDDLQHLGQAAYLRGLIKDGPA